MNILVVGNGFDLAHGLSTTYWDCLNFFEVVYNCINQKTFAYWRELFWRDKIRLEPQYQSLSDEHINFIKNIILKKSELYNMSLSPENIDDSSQDPEYILLYKCLYDNPWFSYFIAQKKNHINQQCNWIDFEKEISFVVQKIDQIIKEACNTSKNVQQLEQAFFSKRDLKLYPFLSEIEYYLQNYLSVSFSRNTTINIIYHDIIKTLYKNLLKFTTAIEIYLKLFNKTIKNHVSASLYDILSIGKIDKVVSFNYTNTFYKYMNKDDIKPDNICFIHGKIRNIITNIHSPLVLGIDEYLDEEQKDFDIDWIMFKKYFQRLTKRCDYHYINWLSESAHKTTHLSLENNLYIFGHSLDITDRDILRELILKNNQTTTVFFKDNEQLDKARKNLVRVIGSKQLTKRERHTPPLIIFKEQDTNLIKNKEQIYEIAMRVVHSYKLRYFPQKSFKDLHTLREINLWIEQTKTMKEVEITLNNALKDIFVWVEQKKTIEEVEITLNNALKDIFDKKHK